MRSRRGRRRPRRRDGDPRGDHRSTRIEAATNAVGRRGNRDARNSMFIAIEGPNYAVGCGLRFSDAAVDSALKTAFSVSSICRQRSDVSRAVSNSPSEWLDPATGTSMWDAFLSAVIGTAGAAFMGRSVGLVAWPNGWGNGWFLAATLPRGRTAGRENHSVCATRRCYRRGPTETSRTAVKSGRGCRPSGRTL